MNALIFLAHGSRRQKSNDEVRSLVDSIRPLLAPKFASIQAAYLEITTPSLRESIDGLLEQGADSITIYPYFLNSGSHVERDIPLITEDFKAANPNCEFVVLRHFGTSESLAKIVVDQVLGGRGT